MSCLTSIRFNLIATVIRDADDTNALPQTSGQWVTGQDPETGEVKPIWQANPIVPEGPKEYTFDIPCSATSFNDTGYRSPANMQVYDDEQLNIFEFIELRYSSRYVVTKDDRITNIRNKRTGVTIWAEEEMARVDGKFRPTTFDVKGVNPQIDPFGKHVENMAILRRIQVQV